MIRGAKPKPTALRRLEGNRGKRGYNADEPVPPEGRPDLSRAYGLRGTRRVGPAGFGAA